MTDTPERIWAWDYGKPSGKPEGLGGWYTKDVGLDGDEVEYIRADLVEEMYEALKTGEDLIKGDLVGVEWKRACREYLKSARTALAKVEGITDD